MSEKAKNIWLWVSAILLAIACTSWLLVQMDTIRWTNRLSTSSAEATKARKAYNTKLNRLRFEVEEDNSRSKNPVLKSVSLQNGSEQLMNTVGSKFFQYMYNYDGASQYSPQRQKLRGMIGGDLKKDKAVVGTGNTVKMIKATGLSSKYDNTKFWIESADDKNIVALGRVQFDSGFTNGPTITHTRVYELNYDKAQQKITKLSLVQSSSEQ